MVQIPDWAESQLPGNLAVAFGPNARLSRCNDPIRIHCILEDLVEFEETAVVPVVCSHDLIHDSQMSSILAPSVGGTVFNKRPDQPLNLFLLRGIFFVEHNADDVV